MPKLLIVEDNELNRDMLSRRLERRGYQVLLAADGERGMALARTEAPDLILMDMSLPIVDGWEATRRLKDDPATRAIPIVGLSAHAMAGDEARARSAGCDDFDTKPIDLPRLLAKLSVWLGPVPNPVPETGSLQALRVPIPLELTVDATPESLARILDLATRATAHFGLDADVAQRVRLAIEEVTSNVIQYGYPNGGAGALRLRLVRGPGALTITIEDDAVGFDPAQVAPPALDGDWAERPLGGLGWHLTRQMVDEVRHEPLPGGGNRVTLVVRLNRPPA